MNTLDKLNSLIGKPYDKENYHCYHLLSDTLDVPSLKDVHVDTALGDIAKYKDMFIQIDNAVNMCIVLIGKKHIGIYYNGGIFHNDTHGVRYEPLRVIKLRYRTFKYYKVKK